MTGKIDPEAPIDCADRSQLEKLYLELRPFAESKTAYLVGGNAVAQDIVQDVFLKAWKLGMQFVSIQDAYRWLYSCCHNAAIDWIRREKIGAGIRNDHILTNPRLVTSEEDRTHNRSVFMGLIDHLSERSCEIVAYRFIDGLGHEEIAALIGTSTKTIQRELNEARMVLGRLMKGEHE